MLRPLSDQHAVAYFDSASFVLTESGAEEVALGTDRGRSSNVGASAPGRSAEAPKTSPASPGRSVRLANIKPAATPDPANASIVGGDNQGWAIALAIRVAVAAVAIGGGYELWQRRTARGGEGTLPHD
jgi:hypothetical protein